MIEMTEMQRLSSSSESDGDVVDNFATKSDSELFAALGTDVEQQVERPASNVRSKLMKYFALTFVFVAMTCAIVYIFYAGQMQNAEQKIIKEELIHVEEFIQFSPASPIVESDITSPPPLDTGM